MSLPLTLKPLTLLLPQDKVITNEEPEVSLVGCNLVVVLVSNMRRTWASEALQRLVEGFASAAELREQLFAASSADSVWGDEAAAASESTVIVECEQALFRAFVVANQTLIQRRRPGFVFFGLQNTDYGLRGWLPSGLPPVTVISLHESVPWGYRGRVDGDGGAEAEFGKMIVCTRQKQARRALHRTARAAMDMANTAALEEMMGGVSLGPKAVSADDGTMTAEDDSHRCWLGELPDELLLKVASHLTFYEQSRVREVCRRLHRVFGDHSLWRDLTTHDFAGPNAVAGPRGVPMIGNRIAGVLLTLPHVCEHLRSLDLSHSGVTVEGLSAIGAAAGHSIDRLNLFGTCHEFHKAHWSFPVLRSVNLASRHHRTVHGNGYGHADNGIIAKAITEVEAGDFMLLGSEDGELCVVTDVDSNTRARHPTWQFIGVPLFSRSSHPFPKESVFTGRQVVMCLQVAVSPYLAKAIDGNRLTLECLETGATRNDLTTDEPALFTQILEDAPNGILVSVVAFFDQEEVFLPSVGSESLY